jgi:hypothetical protein
MEPSQHGFSTLKPWVDSTEEDYSSEEEDLESELRVSILAWQDEYDDFGTWAANATPEERSRCLKTMPRVLSAEQRVAILAKRLGSRRHPDYTSAWLTYLLDVTDEIRALIPRIETFTPEVVPGRLEDEPRGESDFPDLEAYEAELNRLAKLPPQVQAWFREHAQPVWDDYVLAGRHARNALARRRAYLDDPEDFTRCEVLLEGLDSRPDWARAVWHANPLLAERVLGDLLPTPKPKLNFGMRMAARQLAKRSLEASVECNRQRRRLDRRLMQRAARRRRQAEHRQHLAQVNPQYAG